MSLTEGYPSLAFGVPLDAVGRMALIFRHYIEADFKVFLHGSMQR